MSVRRPRPARRAVTLLGAAATLVLGSLVGAQVAAAQTDPAPPATSTPAPSTPRDVVGCEASYEVVSAWPGGFVAAVRVANVSTFSSLARWEVRLDLPEGEVEHAWSSTLVTGAGPTTLRPASWNSFVPYGGTVELGLQGTGSPTPGTVTCLGHPS